MSRVMMAILMFGIVSCGVESGPVPTSAPGDNTTTQTSSDLTSSPDREASPQATNCNTGTCETREECANDGGTPHGPCPFFNTICCI